MARKRSFLPEDLTPYTGCDADEMLGLDPLAIGWLDRRTNFVEGNVPKGFIEKLKAFCHPSLAVCTVGKARPCGLDHHTVAPIDFDGESFRLGAAEIRVIGEEDIFAAPNLIYHYVTEHRYRPPQTFLDAVMSGPQPDSAEYKALIRTLQQFSS